MAYIKIMYLRMLVMLTRLNTYRKMKRTLHSLTLNSIGNLYEVPRNPQEKDRHYERRILKKARRTPPGCTPIPRKKEAAK